MVEDSKTQLGKNTVSSQIKQYIYKCNSSQNTNRIFSEVWQEYSFKIHLN